MDATVIAVLTYIKRGGVEVITSELQPAVRSATRERAAAMAKA